MPLYLVRFGKIAIDLFVISIAYWLAVIVRFEGKLSKDLLLDFAMVYPLVLVLPYFACSAFGLPKFAWRYFGLHETRRLFLALVLSALLLSIMSHLIPGLVPSQSENSDVLTLPLGIILLHCTFSFVGIAGVRSIARIRRENKISARQFSPVTAVPTLLIGAGRAGWLVARELSAHPDLQIKTVGFLDDDQTKAGMLVHGIPVLGDTSRLPQLMAHYEIEQVIITIANAPGTFVRRISELCKNAGVSLKIIPGLYEIVGGNVNISRIRNVAIEDLLRRDPVVLDHDAISQVVQERVVLVTGAGGSIGSELCRQICRFSPKKLVLLEHTENSLFFIDRNLQEAFPHVPRVLCLADIRDPVRLEHVFKTYAPEVLFHAAAHKHVPMMEINPGEAIKNNVLGTKCLADFADKHGVREFVMISTDKAVNPTSVMGVSKRVAEIYIQALSQKSQTRFITVRFGNVLGSNGSVIPIFEEQIKKGGPVTITHPEMKRYFMTIPEASQLVLQAAAIGRGGDILILDMGEPVKIADLARDLIRLSGLRPDEDIEIRYTGMRPGEKLFEELSVSSENASKMSHPKIFVGRFRPYPWDQICEQIDELAELRDSRDAKRIREKFQALVPEYSPQVPEILNQNPGSSRRIIQAIRKCSQRMFSRISARFIPKPE